jgi:hypothetical protein
MATSSRSRRRAGWVVAALGVPWLVYACDLPPLGPAVTGTSTGTGGTGTTASSSSASSTGTTAASSSGTGGTGGGAADGGGDADGGMSCETAVVAYPTLASPHVAICSPVDYPSNPPTSGPHYPIWAAYQTYTTPVPRGFYVHDEEHGGVVILYNCPSGCDADLATLATWLDARPADPACTPPVRARIVVTPDPLIPTRFAAAAWGWALTSQCVDLGALGPFIDAHYAMAPENFCSDGWDVTAADAGIPDGCGTGDGG